MDGDWDGKVQRTDDKEDIWARLCRARGAQGGADTDGMEWRKRDKIKCRVEQGAKFEVWR